MTILISIVGVLLGLGVIVFVARFYVRGKRKTTSKFANIERDAREESFYDPLLKQKRRFPSIKDAPSVTLSIIVPAYNESQRMRPMLDECINILNGRSGKNFSYEIILVDDGSKDDTSEIALEYSKEISPERFRVLKLAKNRGKGGAIRLGVLSSRGQQILFADADGATRFSDLEKLEQKLAAMGKQDSGIAVGSRAHLETKALAERSFFRNLLMYGFKVFVQFVGVKNIRDTQCGFKLFSRSAARKCFLNLHVERWAFDVELLYIAERLDIPVAEVAVNWHEMEGSKLIPVFSWLQMAKDILRMRLNYTFGIWDIDAAVDKRT